MTDLSKITDPFGELPPPVQDALKEYAKSGGKVQFKVKTYVSKWYPVSAPKWHPYNIYRADPAHYTPPDKKWRLGMPAAYRCDPFTEVDVCARPDAEGHAYPILVKTTGGGFLAHMLDGRRGNQPHPFDLVPLQEKPLRKPSVDWSHLGPRVNYLPRDMDGSVWGFSEEPFVDDAYWQLDCDGDAWDLSGVLASYDPGEVDWQDSLLIRPGHKGEK